MPRRRPFRILVATLTLALITSLASCSDDGGDEEADSTDETAETSDGESTSSTGPTTTEAPPEPPELSADEQELADAVQPALAASLDDELSLPPETATCVAGELVDQFGIDGLGELGVTLDQPDSAGSLGGGVLPEEHWVTYADALLACFGFGEILVTGLGAGSDVPGIDPAAQGCIDELAASDEWRPVVVEIVATGRTADETAGPALYSEIITTCADPEAYVEGMLAETGRSPEAIDCMAAVFLGDEARLEALLTGDGSIWQDPAVQAALDRCGE